LIFFKA